MHKYFLASLFLLASWPTFATMEEALNSFKKGNYGAAVKELSALAEAGDMSAQIMLGALYNKGGAVQRDDKIAATWFEKAANQGNVEALYQLGYLYENSQLPRDYKAAAGLYHKAAQQGSAKAQARLGAFYAGGTGVEQNPNEAILWFGKAALQGNTEAQFRLGLMYLIGKTVPKNNDVAKGWLTKAAAQSHADSLFLLAEMYKNGQGVPKDPILAYSLDTLALSNNTTMTKRATKSLDYLADQLSSEQIETSTKLAAELQKPKNFSQAFTSYIDKAHQPPFRFFNRPEK